MNKKKNKKKIIVGTVVGVLIVLGIFIAYSVIKDMKQEDILRTEIANISKKDIAKDRYNTPIKTSGDYSVVEKSIKEYLDDYAVTLQNVLDIMNDEKLTSLLSASNYKEDGPDFNTTKEYLTKTKTSFNEKLNKLTLMTSEEEIMKQIDGKNLDKYYVDLYKELMLRGVAEDDFKTSQDDLKLASERINKILDVEEKVIDLLVSNKGKWSIENDKVVFQNTDTLNNYNELIKQLSN